MYPDNFSGGGSLFMVAAGFHMKLGPEHWGVIALASVVGADCNGVA